MSRRTGRSTGRGTGRTANHPLQGTCPLCDKPLGGVPLVKRRQYWVHKLCWMLEKGE